MSGAGFGKRKESDARGHWLREGCARGGKRRLRSAESDAVETGQRHKRLDLTRPTTAFPSRQVLFGPSEQELKLPRKIVLRQAERSFEEAAQVGQHAGLAAALR